MYAFIAILILGYAIFTILVYQVKPETAIAIWILSALMLLIIGGVCAYAEFVEPSFMSLLWTIIAVLLPGGIWAVSLYVKDSGLVCPSAEKKTSSK